MPKINSEFKKLKEVCDFSRGLTYSKSDEVDISNNIVLRATNINLNSHSLDLTDLRFISDSIKIPQSKIIKTNSLLICTASGSRSHLGKVALININYPYAFGGFLGQITPKDNIIPKYLYYIFLSERYNKLLQKISSGTNINNLKFSDIENFTFSLPSILEQQRIVKILDEVFEKIDEAKENTKKNIQNTEVIFGSYFAEQSIKQGICQTKTIGEVCELHQGIAINAKTRHALVKKSDLPLLRIKDLKNNTVEQFIDPNNFPKNALVNENDLIYTRTGQIGLVFMGKRGVLHNNSFKITPNNSLNRKYLFYWLQNPVFKSKIIELSSRAAQPDITHSIFKQQLIYIPTLAKQNRIVISLDQLMLETQKLEQLYKKKLADLEELKKSILERAFNGDL